jgi:peroxiredoxin
MSAARIRTLAAAALLGTALVAPALAREVGQTAPDFSAPGVAGGTVSLAPYRGKVIYLDFWASWCGPCAQALPALDSLRKEFPESDFQVLAVNVDRQASLARAFLKKRPVGYPSALDPKGEIPATFDVQTMPTSFLIDRNGVIQHIQRGFRPDDVPELRNQIQRLVAQPRTATRR